MSTIGKKGYPLMILFFSIKRVRIVKEIRTVFKSSGKYLLKFFNNKKIGIVIRTKEVVFMYREKSTKNIIKLKFSIVGFL
jgi:hypothetical protein